MKANKALILSFIAPVVAASPLPTSPWVQYLNDEQRVFCEEQMVPALKLYHEGKEVDALGELDRAYERAEAAYALNPRDRVHFFHRIIWWEAQVRTGRDDPDWGAKLYGYLYNRDVLKGGTVKMIPPSEYLLIGNITDCLEETGKAAEAQSWILHLEDNICTYRGINTTNTTVYADRGAVFAFIPAARKRVFPLYRHEVPELKTCSCTAHAIDYPYLYAIKDIADNALKSGDWIRAAELYHWFLSYTDMYIASEKYDKRNEVVRINQQAIQSLAEICTIHGYPEEIPAMYDHAMGQIKENQLTQNGTLEFARLYREASKIKLGTITEDAIPLADESVRKLSSVRYYPHSQIVQFKLLRARIYHALGHKEEAWRFVNQLFEATQQDVNPYLWTYMLTTMIDLAMDDEGTHPELENWLILALSNERLKGNKFGELPLYEKYARLLVQQGRYAEAIEIQKEALRLAKAMNLHERTGLNQRTLDSINTLQTTAPRGQVAAQPRKTEQEARPREKAGTAGSVAISEHSAPKKTAGTISTPTQHQGIDIQPYQSTAVSLAGQPAYGRFYFYNPTAKTQDGMLRFSGAVGSPQWQTDNWLTIGSSPELPITQKDESLTVPAGVCCVVDITALPEQSGSPTTIQCEWIPNDPKQKGSSAEWEYRTAPTDRRTAVIDAHAIRENPFYLIPVHHMIQRPEASIRENVDFTVEASAPMRIEVYSGETHELLAVDANGDGDFKDAGDFIGLDENRNNWPDIGFNAGQKLTSLVMYIRLADESDQAEAELTVKILDNEAWRVDAVDLIKFAQ